jgi:hypothetical protein
LRTPSSVVAVGDDRASCTGLAIGLGEAAEGEPERVPPERGEPEPVLPLRPRDAILSRPPSSSPLSSLIPSSSSSSPSLASALFPSAPVRNEYDCGLTASLSVAVAEPEAESTPARPGRRADADPPAEKEGLALAAVLTVLLAIVGISWSSSLPPILREAKGRRGVAQRPAGLPGLVGGFASDGEGGR